MNLTNGVLNQGTGNTTMYSFGNNCTLYGNHGSDNITSYGNNNLIAVGQNQNTVNSSGTQNRIYTNVSDTFTVS